MSAFLPMARAQRRRQVSDVVKVVWICLLVTQLPVALAAMAVFGWSQ